MRFSLLLKTRIEREEDEDLSMLLYDLIIWTAFYFPCKKHGSIGEEVRIVACNLTIRSSEIRFTLLWKTDLAGRRWGPRMQIPQFDHLKYVILCCGKHGSVGEQVRTIACQHTIRSSEMLFTLLLKTRIYRGYIVFNAQPIGGRGCGGGGGGGWEQ